MIEIRSIDHPGIVKVQHAWFYVIGTTADFILDYPSYDPTYDPNQRPVPFRDGLLVVTPDDGFRYLHALREGVVPIDSLDELVAEYGPDRTRPQFLIDFDSATFASAFFDQTLEDEVAPGWTGSYSDPMAACPISLQGTWPPFKS